MLHYARVPSFQSTPTTITITITITIITTPRPPCIGMKKVYDRRNKLLAAARLHEEKKRTVLKYN